MQTEIQRLASVYVYIKDILKNNKTHNLARYIRIYLWVWVCLPLHYTHGSVKLLKHTFCVVVTAQSPLHVLLRPFKWVQNDCKIYQTDTKTVSKRIKHLLNIKLKSYAAHNQCNALASSIRSGSGYIPIYIIFVFFFLFTLLSVFQCYRNLCLINALLIV